jgi:peptidoglycan biosynthesis protein MviN/MurJ (putative lipid II flippase)
MFFFAFSIPFEGLFHLLSRIYYAFKNTWIPVLINVLFLGVNILVAFKFADVFGANVFAISFSLGSIMQVFFLTFFLKKYVKLPVWSLFKSVSLILVASGLMGGLVWWLNGKIHLLVTILVAIVFYFIFARSLGILHYAGIGFLDKFITQKK